MISVNNKSVDRNFSENIYILEGIGNLLEVI